jgi:BirA family biotin operon repressor/biotin-[acetyl-CoA-carboxylase] ligase
VTSQVANRGRDLPNPASPLSAGTRLSRVVQVLSENAMLVVSGTKIAQEIGASRSEVWRLVQQLRGLGVQIAGHPATGYRLEAIPDLLLPDALEPLLKGTLFSGHLHHYFRIASTNQSAMAAAQAGAPEGTVFFAEEQTSGRGRGGHRWHSERSTGIYVSVILRPHMSPADVVALSLMAGLAAAAAVEEVTGLKPDLRWPNDLLLPGCSPAAQAPAVSHPLTPQTSAHSRQTTNDEPRKLCGILTELSAELTQVRYAVVGIGINVNQQNFPAELQRIATSLRMETGQAWSRVHMAAALLQSLDREYRRVRQSPAREELFRRFEQASSYVRGCPVHVDENGGYQGVTEGLDDRGFLLVRTAGGSLKKVISGGVRKI